MDCTHHASVGERRWKYEEVINSESVRAYNLFFRGEEAARVSAEFPICVVNELRLCPNSGCPIFAFNLRERFESNITACDCNEI